jgi:hypothetical protein
MSGRTDIPVAYTPGAAPHPSSEELRARIPGWGADLDPADRPSYPKLVDVRDRTGAHWDLPDRQPGWEGRERSIEHAFVTPVFGTAQPLNGVSGATRRLAYRRYSEGRTAHWLLLVLGDRLDVAGSRVRALASGRPDNPFGTGLRTEVTHHGVRSRFGQKRSDWKHQWMDPFVTAGPWVLGGGVVVAVLRRLRR